MNGSNDEQKVVHALSEITKEIESAGDNIPADGILAKEKYAIERLLSKKNGFEYRIRIKTSDLLDGLNDRLRGRIEPYRSGAVIRYSDKATRLQQLIIVAHELGHAYFEHKEDAKNNSLTPQNTNGTGKVVHMPFEDIAFAFAKQLVATRYPGFTRDEIESTLAEIRGKHT